MTRILFKHVLEGGQQITSYLILATPSEWAERPESSSPLWEAHVSGDSVVALAVDVNNAMAGCVGALPSDSRRN